jgi:hypothetical protein
VLQSVSRIEELAKIFIHATKVSCSNLLRWSGMALWSGSDADSFDVQMEIAFWEMYSAS